MTDKFKQIIIEKIAELPKENQEAIRNFDWAKMADEIARKYLYDESQINDVQVETFLVLVGLTDPKYFSTYIENGVGTIKEVAENITKEIYEKIFTPINDHIIENIKKSEKAKNPKWDQNLGFIMSGGDYTSFAERKEPITTDSSTNTNKTNVPLKPDSEKNKIKLVI